MAELAGEDAVLAREENGGGSHWRRRGGGEREIEEENKMGAEFGRKNLLIVVIFEPLS